jgi:hypothetical protein
MRKPRKVLIFSLAKTSLTYTKLEESISHDRVYKKRRELGKKNWRNLKKNVKEKRLKIVLFLQIIYIGLVLMVTIELESSWV